MSEKPQLAVFHTLTGNALIDKYLEGLKTIHPDVLKLSDEKMNQRFEGGDLGTWSVRELIGHLVESEIVFMYRMRSAAAEDQPTFSPWNEDAFVKQGLYVNMPVKTAIDTLTGLRQWNAAWLRTLSEEGFQRVGVSTSGKQGTVHSILAFCAYHLEFHNWYLDQKMKVLL